MAKREKTWWAIKGKKGFVLEDERSYRPMLYLYRTKSECKMECDWYKLDSTERPVRVKLVEVK